MSTLSKTGSFTLLALASTTIMVGCVIVPALPSIAAALGVPNAAGWLVTIPSLGVILFGTVAGKLIERLGSRRALCCGLFAYGLLGTAGMFLSGAAIVFADRLLLGGATAIIMAAGTGLISDFFDGDARMGMMAKQGMAIELGGVIFLFAGGLLATAGWQWPFLLYLVGWVFLAMVLLFVPKTARATPTVTGAREMLPAEMKYIYAVALGSMILFFAGIIFLPLRLKSLGFGEAQTGYFLSFVSLMAVVAAALMPMAVRRVGEASALCAAFCLYTAAHLLFAFAGSVPLFVAGAVAMGAGFGLSVPLVNGLTVNRCSAPLRARGLAYLSMALFSGQFLSSFMELLPGGANSGFVVAATVGALAATAIALGRGKLAQARPG
jgi:MFS family permease